MVTSFKDKALIMKYRTVLYLGSWRLGISYPKISPQNQLNIYFMTSRQYFLGIAKLKNVFRSTINQDDMKMLNLLFNRISID